MARLAHAGCRAGDLRVTPFNGRLFAPGGTPLADQRRLDDEAARRAVLALSTRAVARRAADASASGTATSASSSSAPCTRRCSTTRRRSSAPAARRPRPRAVVSLEPGSDAPQGDRVVLHAAADRRLPRAPHARSARARRRAGSHPRRCASSIPRWAAARSSWRRAGYLAAAYESALVAAGGCRAGRFRRRRTRRDPPDDRRALPVRRRRQPDGGSARAPFALAGDARGRSAADLSRSPAARRRQPDRRVARRPRPRAGACARRRPASEPSRPLFDAADDARGAPDALPVRFSLERVAGRHRRAGAREGARARVARAPRLGDRALEGGRRPLVRALVCAARSPGADGRVHRAERTRSSAERGALPAADRRSIPRARAEIAAARRFFHWELEFPEVFFDADGSARARRPASTPSSATRRGTCCGPTPARRPPAATRRPLVRFTRDSGRLRGAVGRPREPVSAVRRTRRRARRGPADGSGSSSRPGLRPTTAARPLRRLLFEPVRRGRDGRLRQPARDLSDPSQREVPAAVGLVRVADARRSPAGWASTTPHRSNRSATSPPTQSPWFPVRVTPALLERLTGDELAIPDLKDPIDLAIAERAAALFPPLGSAAGWGARFGRELNATDDRGVAPPRRLGGPAGRRGQAAAARSASISARPASGVAPGDARRLLRPPVLRAPAPRVSRRGERDEPPDAHRGRPSRRLRLDAHGLLPADAACRSRGSTCSAASSTASS